jgi:hypothetical protein
MPDETSDGGFELMRLIVNLGGVVLTQIPKVADGKQQSSCS